ncbi:hypothetical protein [Thiocystis minor]|uniref:hypothetical protein n=1 Tax=Thiocystis minor TaxID=61597 RepID=UPI001912AD34|nr:hypothetical protein [Thiocystis minor]
MNESPKFPPLLTLLILSFFLTDPRHTDTDTGTRLDPSRIDPCDLLPPHELETLLGAPVGLPVRSILVPLGTQLCAYETVGGDPGAFIQVSLTQAEDVPRPGPSPSDIFQKTRESMATRTEIDRLGDAAFIATGGLNMLIGEDFVQLAAGNTDRPEVRQRLLRAGEIVLDNLARRDDGVLSQDATPR